jgi:hypothetical protein
MLPFFNYEVRHKLNEQNRIKKLNQKINKNVKQQQIFGINGSNIEIYLSKKTEENNDSKEFNKIEFKETTPIIPKKFEMIIGVENKNIGPEIFPNSMLFKDSNNFTPKSFDILTDINIKIDEKKETLLKANKNDILFKDINNFTPKPFDIVKNINIKINEKEKLLSESEANKDIIDGINKVVKKKINMKINNDNVDMLNNYLNDKINNIFNFKDINNFTPKPFDIVKNINIKINEKEKFLPEPEPKPETPKEIMHEINNVFKIKNFNMKTENDNINKIFNIQGNKNILENKDIQKKTSKVINLDSNPFILNIVYQYEYKNKSITGFGDFIRGIYFALQFSEKYNICLEITINNHLIKKFLPYFYNKPNIDKDIASNIPFFTLENYKYKKNNRIIDYDYIDMDSNFADFLLNLKDYNNYKYIYTNNHPKQKLISNAHIEFVKNILKPSDEIYFNIEKSLSNLKITKHKFITIHIRTSDKCFLNKKSLDLNKNFVFLFNFIKKIYLHHKLDVFILSSDNNVKLYIAKYFPNVKFIIYNITHTCLNDNEEGVMNTLKDFYIMSFSKYIYCFSVYEHGSGFSKWCALTYNIPYVCYYLENNFIT